MFRKWHPYLMVLPAILLILGVFISGLVFGFLQSLGFNPILGMNEFTLAYYREIFSRPVFWNALGFSLSTSLTASLISAVLGLSAALLLSRSGRSSSWGGIIFKIPIAVPHTVAALIAYTMLSQSGFLSRILFHLGIIQSTTQAPLLIFDPRGVGIILAYVWKSMPFIALLCHGTLLKLDRKMMMNAHTLGANRFQVVIHILIPQLMPTLVSAFILIFAFSFGAFELPFLLGPSTPKTLPVYAYSFYQSLDLSDRSYAMVVNMVLTAGSLLLVMLYSAAGRRLLRRR